MDAGNGFRTLHALDLLDGHELWSVTSGSTPNSYAYASTPVVGTGMVYFGSWDSKLYAVIPQVGQGALAPAPWPLTTVGSILSSPTIANNTVYVGSQDGSIYAVVEHDSLGAGDSPKFRKNLKNTAGP